jgi:glycosyltransferase involved in cell wall biosynthesis
MKILIYSHFYKPEAGAASVRIQYLVEAIKKAGYEFLIISPYPNYPHRNLFKNCNIKEIERIENVKFLPAYFPKSDTLITRMFFYFSYMITSAIYSLLILPKYDVILNSSPPITTSLVACIIAKTKRSKFIWDIRDIWPDIGIEIGILKNNFIINIFRKVEKFLLKNSNYITVTAEGDKYNLIKKGYNKSNIITLFNGADTNLFVPLEENEKKQIKMNYNIPIDKKIMIYFGSFNYGMNDVELLSQALSELHGYSDKFHLVLIGDGNSRNDFISRIKNKIGFTYFNNLNKEEIARILASSDWSLIPRKFIENDTGGNIPVKCFESWSCGIPVLLSGIEGTDIYKIFNKVKLGKFIKPNNLEEFKQALIEILEMNIDSEIKDFGRKFVVENFDRNKESQKLINIIEAIK